jgi:hypothetical protein
MPEEREKKFFYFTYGSDEKYPFYGGWTLVNAFDIESAIAIFQIFHPDITPNIINCAFIYDEDEFNKTDFLKKGNLGYYCHEEIYILRKLSD